MEVAVLSQIVAFVLGTVAGVVGCWVFWRALLAVRPKVKFAELAAFCETSKCLGVKVANLGRHQVTDIEARMAVADRTQEGRIITRIVGKLNAPTLLAFEPLAKLNEPWLLPTVFVFVAINGEEMVRCLGDQLQGGGDRRLLFTLSMRDGLSGTKIVKRAIFSSEQVRSGWYDHALFFQIIPDMIYEPSIETNYVTII